MHYDRKVAQKLGDTVALRAVEKPHPERTGVVAQTETPIPAAQPTTPTTKPVETVQPVQPKTDPIPQKPVETPKTEPQKPAETPKTETQKPAVKTDTMEVNGIQVLVEKPQQPKKPKESQPVQESEQPAAQPQPTQPEKVDGANVFVLDPYSISYKSAYYPYTSRPVFENNKTKFILARPGDTYQKLAASLQMTEKNLRLYNDVYDGSEPIEDEVIYLEMKSTKSSVPYHALQEGDTYRYIAQRYGIQLKILIKRNSGNINNYKVGDQICIGCN